eukprot:COSAG01_NODE_168_length_23206_cov_14.301467_18_plen_188_part_00
MGVHREGRKPGIFASICQAYLTPATIIRAATLLNAASAVTDVSAPGSRYIARLTRAQLPMYLTVLGRWTEVLEFWQNASSAASHPSQPPMPPWPFEQTFRAAFNTFNSTMYNTSDPLKMAVSDYDQTVAGITMDDSAETAMTYWHLITSGGPTQPNGATALCSPAYASPRPIKTHDSRETLSNGIAY